MTNASTPSSISNGSVIKTSYTLFDKVEFTFGVFEEKPSVDELRSLWTKVLRHIRPTSPYSTLDHDVVFTETLALGRHVGDLTHWEICRALYIQHLKGEGQHVSHQQEEFDVFHNWVQTCTQHRKFILTERGYFGLAPALVERNDVCGMAVDAMSPDILRETSSPGYYKFIGGVYIPCEGRSVHHAGDESVHMRSICEEIASECAESGLEEQDIYLC